VKGEALLWLPNVLRQAGLEVVEYEGWQTRSRSSGGYLPDGPLAVFWHHTASRATPGSDARWMCYNSPSRPIANLMVPDDGTIWVLAAGCTNTNGKGQRMTFSRGVVPQDAANTRVVGVEICNDGVGELYSQHQIDVAFAASNAINGYVTNQARDVATHHSYARERKIDPATAKAVQGGWQPRSVSTAGSWNLDDLRDECDRRSVVLPPIPPPPSGEEEFMLSIWGYSGADTNGALYAVSSAGHKYWLTDSAMVGSMEAYCAVNGWDTKHNGTSDRGLFKAFGPVLGPLPERSDAWGLPV
jgi:hypothetical protein